MRFWKISPGRSGRYWEYFRDGGMMAIGWLYDLGDLDNYKTGAAIRKEAIKRGHPTGGGRPRITQVIEFYTTEINDVVVAFGDQTVLDIGIINGSYYYVDGDEYYFYNVQLYPHRKSVHWLNIFDEHPVISDELLHNLRYTQDSIHELTDQQDIDEIIGYLNGSGYYLSEGLVVADVFRTEQDLIREEKKRSRLDFNELSKQVAKAPLHPAKYESSVTQYSRNSSVLTYAKLRAHGVCDLCGERGPFLDRNGAPFLESHHIVWLSEGGEDSIENTVALCPNCHRKMHIIADADDVAFLKRKT